MRKLIFIFLAIIGVSQAQTIQYIGAPTTTVISRGNFRTDSIFYLPKRSKAPTDTAAFRYQISDSSLYVWTGSQWIKAGGSGTISGTGITGYVPQFNGTTTIDTSALFTLGSRLGIGSSTFAYTSTNTANVELNGTAGGILGFKRNDSARGYLWHTGDNMELANTAAGAISFNTNSSTRGSISSAGVWRLHNLAGTGDRVVVASSNGTLSASTSVTGLVDTTTISTRAWRQKGDDSLGAIIATKGIGTVTSVASGFGTNFSTITSTGSVIVDSLVMTTKASRDKLKDSLQANINAKGTGTVTSVATGYGLSGGTITTTGTLLVDTLNISTRAWRQKGLDSLAALEVSGSGTTNYVPKFTAASTIGNSQIFDNGTNVGIGTATPSQKLHVSGGNLLVQRAYSSGNIPLEILNSAVASKGQSYDVGFFQANDAPSLRITEVNSADNSITGELTLSAGDGNVQLIGSTGPMVFNAGRANSSAGYIVGTNHLRIFANGRVGVNTTTDAGYQFDINGTLRSVNGANFATTSGNVGIGTTSPVHTLHLNSSFTTYAHFTNSNSGTTNADGMSIGVDGNDYYLWVRENQPLYIGTNSTSRLLIKADGELLINTTTDAGDYKLQVSGNIYNTGSAVLAATSGNVGIGTASPGQKFTIQASSGSLFQLIKQGSDEMYIGYDVVNDNFTIQSNNRLAFHTGASFTERMRVDSAGEVLINTTTDAGDYKLQVSGNARIGTGKLDISSNTAFSMNVQRSGTSEVAGTFNNSNGILYLGAESSTGGSLFTGSSAYAAVIGSGAAYPLQFATNNVVRATINADGEMLIGGTDVGLYNLQVTGNAYTQTFQYVGNVLGINTGTYNSAGTAQITMKNGTNPDGSVTDQFILYSADVVAGNAAPHFRTENGGIIKLYQETTAVGAATFTANSGTAVNDASTFDGYTLKQIVKALRNQGILQ